VRGVRRQGGQRPLDHSGTLIVVDGSRPARASLVEQTFAAILQKAPAPLANRMLMDAKLGGDGLAGQSV